MADPRAKMTVVNGPVDPGKPGRARYRTVYKDGSPVRIRIIDPDSPDFAAQFLSAFRSNVRKARKENQALADKA